MMKRVASLALVPLFAATAYADDPPLAPPSGTPAPIAQPAPHNEDWGNVSHINGTPVKVGERNDYLYKFKRTNVSANPFGVFWGYYDASLSYGLTQNLAVSVSASGWSVDHGYQSGYQATASLPIYFRRTYSGPFLEPGVIVRNTGNNNYACDTVSGGSCGNSRTWAGPELLFGWQWSFDSGLNLALAFGVAKHVTDTQPMDTYSSNEPDANGYFRIGYAF